MRERERGRATGRGGAGVRSHEGRESRERSEEKASGAADAGLQNGRGRRGWPCDLAV